jgi:hypothetical protein
MRINQPGSAKCGDALSAASSPAELNCNGLHITGNRHRLDSSEDDECTALAMVCTISTWEPPRRGLGCSGLRTAVLVAVPHRYPFMGIFAYSLSIGIGRPLTVTPLPHHRAYGSRTTAFRQSLNHACITSAISLAVPMTLKPPMPATCWLNSRMPSGVAFVKDGDEGDDAA